jgi:DTW domain-containing protein YfiP
MTDGLDTGPAALEAARMADVPARRPTCARCLRPTRVCYCRFVEPVDTATRVVILQHPRERDMAIGTARMASLCLPNAELHVGVDWGASEPLRRALSDPARPPILLYPGEGAKDVLREPPAGPVTLVVVDGTWWQARKLVRVNPILAALPRYAFSAPEPSEYRIRKEPNEAYVSTIEALAYVLGALEGDPARMRALLRPFRAMVDAQIACIQGENHGRHGKRRARPPAPRVPPWLGERAEDVVCVFAEANAWPLAGRAPEPASPDELVQLVACRLATGERFEAIAAPRRALSPTTPGHTELSAEELASGGPIEALLDGWRAFVREGDILCGWGPYGLGLLRAIGAFLPGARLDLRVVSRDFARRRLGSLERTLGELGLAPEPPMGRGRGGRRLGELVALARHLVEAARLEASARHLHLDPPPHEPLARS